MKKFLVLAACAIFLSGCAHVISKQYRESAVKGVSFGRILANSSAYLNQTFIFGGTIAETRNTKEGSEIEVVQNPIDQYGEITDKDVSDGRFIIVTSKRLDPLIFTQGRLITFAGKLTGTREQLLGGQQYVYPLFGAEEIHLFKPVSYYDAPYPWYNPFYSPYYPYGPYWYGSPYWRPYYYPYWW